MKDLSIVGLLDVIGELFSDEVSIAITDKENYIYYRPSKRIDLKITPGDPIVEGTLAYKAMSGKQKVSEFIDRELFGVPYHGMAVPFQHEGELEGCILAIYPAFTEGKSVITIKTQDGWIPISFSDVIYLEAKDRKTHIVTKTFSGMHTSSLQNFEYRLPRESFIRCHRSFIVNVHHIKEIYPDTHSTFLLAMENGEKVSVSQSYSSYFRKLLGF
ncbi:LytTR family DNA-binding domain-containing protein [Psychrobacillus soli]|uniref:LytTR family transcriptional regulator n=1 Tax=Psychrobacillus soli TaxID=1543965 RepID=A0A544SYV9_9BACI|nr:LytTR family DNA-binding domain-containing protein [Psychrobacillus soli]TQR10351.1 LytTR family transcriptional regulator [Psychrobacillus soli]